MTAIFGSDMMFYSEIVSAIEASEHPTCRPSFPQCGYNLPFETLSDVEHVSSSLRRLS
jgi:hypothetical protein